MYRISVEMLPGYWERIDFLLKWAKEFEDFGIVLGADLEEPDLRLIHHDIALKEWNANPGRIDVPLIVYECTDAAGIEASETLRELLSHPKVRFWLKRNAFRDVRLNNEPYLAGRWHYAEFLKYPTLGVDRVLEAARKTLASPKQIDSSSYEKVRLLPIVPTARFDTLTSLGSVCSPADRHIDVSFVGKADFQETDSLLPYHRRAAALQIVNLRHRRTFIGLNGSVREDVCLDALQHSKISVSPWSFGECSHRDYESILCGCVLVKPNTEHVVTFQPSLYQSNRYYVPCRPDFEDLPDVVQKILDDFEVYHDMAMQARRDLLAANSKGSVTRYFLNLIDAARVDQNHPSKSRVRREQHLATFLQARDSQAPIVDLRTTVVTPVRSTLRDLVEDPLVYEGENPLRMSEDWTASDSHDLRLVSSEVLDGWYELVLAVRPREVQKVCLFVHSFWKDMIRVMFDANFLATAQQANGDTFELGRIECRRFYSEWSFLKVQLRVTGSPGEVGICVALVDAENNAFYSGDGISGIDLGILSLYPILDRAAQLHESAS